jgi:NAD(P)-dependent dehydrogenase (short-subunit alcohol dehydrogenase family)
MNVVVTGASRGIGLELARLALERGAKVMAVARKPKESAGLADLAGRFGEKLQVVQADLTDFAAASHVTKALEGWDKVDVLINNAGILRQGITPEDFMQSFQVNSVAPFLMAKALVPWLKKSGDAKVASVTSLMGSIGDNKSGGHYSYRASKAALNMINKSLSLDMDWLTAVVVHPGWVKTSMGGSGAPVEPADSAKGIWNVIEKAGASQSGGFFNYTGEKLPW